MDATSARKYLKIYNFETTNAVKVKLTTTIYHHEMFHLA